MLESEIAHGPHGRVVLMDSITKVTEGDYGACVVSASHGGVSSGEFAPAVRLGGLLFDHAGVAKEFSPIVARTNAQKAKKAIRHHVAVTGMAAFLALATSVEVLAASATTIVEAQVVETKAGSVRGVTADKIDSYLGIPYAAPPVGPLRWRAPQPPISWTGVRDAKAYGSRCPQGQSSNGPRSEAEDCLFINVQRPAGMAPDDRRPVFVFIHGGGLINGSSNQADMAAIVEETGVIGVTFNYRLGALGFLAHPALTAESGESGNYGLMDQQEALRWVHTNIANFGGDPDRVTIGGQSAGGWSVCAHLTAPNSAGLFSRAIIQSGSCISQSQNEADKGGEEIARQLGCSEGVEGTNCLRDASVSSIIDLPASGYPNGYIIPVHGTSFLPRPPRRSISSGEFSRVPLVVGGNLDEGRTDTQGNIGWSKSDYLSWIGQTFASKSEQVIRMYPWPENSDKFTGAYLSGAIFTDSGLSAEIGGCATRRLASDFARYTDTHVYEFAHRTGPGLTPTLGDYQWGAGHAAELAYLFPSFDNGTPIAPSFNADEQSLAHDMKVYWAAFVQGKEPPTNLSAWPPYGSNRQVLSLRPGGNTKLISDDELAREHNCAFWDTP